MSRHQEIFNDISEILETEEYEPERFQEMCYELAEEIDELREVIRACAAGPWRTDVENAPTGDGCWLVMFFSLDNPKPQLGFCNIEALRRNGFEITAWSVPNPTQVTT